MMKDQPGGTNIPELWRMAVLMKMCPKEIKHNIELCWDTIDEKYSVMRDKVVMWATNAAEKEGGAVLMDVGIVEGGGCEEYEGNECHEYEWVDAVYPTTRCSFCQGYCHMVCECPAKSKGRGGAKGGGKGEAEKEDPKEEAAREREKGTERAKEWERRQKKDLVTRGSAGHAGRSVTSRRSATSTWLATWSSKRVWTR